MTIAVEAPVATTGFVRRYALALASVVVIAVAVFGAVGWSIALQRGAQIDNLTTTARRGSPVTIYNNAFFQHLDCIKAYETRFFGDITDALTVDRTDPDAGKVVTAVVTIDRAALKSVRTLCPAPKPPEFDANGQLVTAPEVFPQTLPAP
jgi:hypothetical protein